MIFDIGNAVRIGEVLRGQDWVVGVLPEKSVIPATFRASAGLLGQVMSSVTSWCFQATAMQLSSRSFHQVMASKNGTPVGRYSANHPSLERRSPNSNTTPTNTVGIAATTMMG